MGNQITAKTPYEILPVERYFTSLPNTSYENSLGSTRFLKVAQAKTAEGQLVVKVFVIHDPTLSLKPYSQQSDDIRDKLNGATNCLPFQYNVVSDKAGFLVRQYVKYNLYDRISTRPFLTSIEKKWIAFQLLSALSQCYNHQICHGDIKSENILLTSWNWVLLADFANFKPTHLPENNPSDYNYFFDTSRRRTCYVAPERFKEGSAKSSDLGGFDIASNDAELEKGGELTHAMDVFSLGCVLIELFSEGKVPFTLSQLLSYRNGDYSPWKILDMITDRNIKELLKSMIQKKPAHRLTSEEYLSQQRGKAFPSYFYTYLKVYVQNYRLTTVLPDDRIAKIRKDLPVIIKNTGVTKGQDGYSEPLILILEIITASIRELKFCENKLTSLRLLLEFSEYLPADITLDRIIPHMMYLLEDSIPRVKAEAIRAVTLALSNIRYVPKTETNLFPDYILPAMNNLTSHDSVLVRVSLAENIATLAETAVRFLELSQVSASADMQVDYELELKTLHDLVQVKVVSLLSDTDNSVKMAMLHHSIIKLAVLFGKQKASDIILSHMITFLNDKRDWKLRAEFYQCIVGVASYIGWQSTSVLQPLIEQGLSDCEEFVIRKSLEALNKLLSLSLIHKPVIHHLMAGISPLLCHPNKWIRYGSAQCISTIATMWSIADVHCNIIPIIKPFLKQPALQINRLDVLLHCLHDPIPRPVHDFLIKSSHLDKYFGTLEDRQLQRNITKSGHTPSYTQCEEAISQMSKKLCSLGLTESHEDRLLRMKDFIIKLHHQHKFSAGESDSPNPGQIDISLIRVQRRHADLLKPDTSKRDGTLANYRASTASNLTLNASRSANETSPPQAPVSGDVRSMFTGTDFLDTPQTLPAAKLLPSQTHTPPGVGDVIRSPSPQSLVQGDRASPDRRPSTVSGGYSLARQATLAGRPEQQFKQSKCKLDLRTLVHHKRDEYGNDYRNKEQMMDNLLTEGPSVPIEWKPQGILVSHIHEHKDSISRILVSSTQDYFITGSRDGSIKLWDTYKSDTRLCNTSRSRSTYSKIGGKILDMSYCTRDNWIACLNTLDTITLLNIESGAQSTMYNVKDSHSTDPHLYGHITTLAATEYGPRTVINYGTVQGYILGWDIRANRLAYKLKHDLSKGLITCMTSHPQEKWLCVGSARGCITLYDMRFHLPVNSILHPTGLRVNRLVSHPTESSWVIGSILGNNEVSMWNLETKQRQTTLWASPTPLLSTKECTKHWTNGLYVHNSDNKSFILSGGTDMRIRYWNILSPTQSMMVSHAATDPHNNTLTQYKSQVVDGTDCVVETYSRNKSAQGSAHSSASSNMSDRRDKPHPGHHDVITDVTMYHTTEPFIVSASACGVVKVWK